MKYVTCEIMGGLGNQLFQIFATIAYAMKHNWTFVFPYSEELWGHNEPRYTAWDSFLKDLKKYTVIDKQNEMISTYLPSFPIYREDKFSYKEIPCNNNFMFLKLHGYFQSYKYFEKYYDKITNLINLNQQIKEVYENNKDLLSDEYNISMHFRVGDYKQLQEYHPIMPFRYYYNSLKYILDNKKEENVKIIYFCEKHDIDFVNETIAKLKLHFEDLKFIRANDDIKDWQQMLLMSCCHANIIANSSFSWWGAYFNNNPNKIVCYPNKWFGPSMSSDHHEISDLVPSTWNKINIRKEGEY